MDNNNTLDTKHMLNKTDVFVLAFGAMIGWGWVVLTGTWLEAAGTMGAMLAFVLGGVLVTLIGLVYAELASAMPQKEGVLAFSMRAFGKGTAFVCTWGVLLGFVGVIAFEAVALPTVISYLFGDYTRGYLYTIAGFDVYANWLAIGMVASLVVAGINIIGIKTAAILQTVLTIVIMISGLVLLGGSAVNGSISNMEPMMVNGLGGVFSVAVMTPFLYIGFDVIPQAAGEMNIPAKRIGGILILSVVFAVVWYVMIIACVGADLSADMLVGSALPTAEAMEAAFGGKPIMGKMLVLGGISGIMTSWNAFYIGASRLIAAMADAGMLKKWLGAMHPRFKTPYKAILMIAVITSMAPLLGRTSLAWLADAGSFTTVIGYMIVSLSFLRLRKREPDMVRPFSVKRWRFIGVGAFIMCVFMMILCMPGLPSALIWPYEWLIVAFWAALGLILYLSKRLERKKD